MPWVDEHYRTLADRDRRAIAGKSSGGCGAMVTAMLRPDLFGAFATHAGDAFSGPDDQGRRPSADRGLRLLVRLLDGRGRHGAPPVYETGATVPDVWARWLANDPVVMAEQPAYADALRSIWIDAGNRDEHYLDLGATAFRKAVAAAGVPDDRVYFELFDAGHAAIEYRSPLSLAWLCKRLA